jgi:acyl-CoA thioesterase FadM
MARVQIELPGHFEFATDIAVRIGDINYGGHLGHDSIISLIHEGRVRFLQAYGYAESDIDGFGLIVSDLAIVYKTEAFYGERLTIEVGAQEFTKYGLDLVYRVSNKETGKEVARAKTGIVIFDYGRRKVASLPERFKAALASKQLERADP